MIETSCVSVEYENREESRTTRRIDTVREIAMILNTVSEPVQKKPRPPNLSL